MSSRPLFPCVLIFVLACSSAADQPDGGAGDDASVAPDAPTPDAAASADASVADAVVPDAAIPDAAIPDAAIPDAAIPDAYSPPVQLFFSAHEDDDLLFMNPDIGAAIDRGDHVRVVFFTAGDAGNDASYWLGREAGIRAAYAQMAAVADDWATTMETHAGKTLRVQTLTGADLVEVAFMRLPDGNPNGTGYAVTGYTSLERLWTGEIATLPTVDDSETYTRAELLATLSALVAALAPTRIGTMDSTGEFAGDHSDHRHGALFAFEAQRGLTDDHALHLYRGYNINDLPASLAAVERDQKWATFAAYAPHDTSMCGGAGADCLEGGAYGGWAWRQVAIMRILGRRGHIVGLQNKCLDAGSATPGPGDGVQLWSCLDGDARQQWHIGSDGRIGGPGGTCLRAPLSANGTAVELADCASEDGQRWTVTSNGQVRGPNGVCLDVRGGDSTDGTVIQVWSCVDVPQQNWSPRFGPVTRWTQDGELADADVGAESSQWGSVRLGDVNADNRADACVRRADGVWCALNTGAAFAGYTRFTDAFSDAEGWSAEAYGATLQLADLNGDSRADLCGRAADGIHCALASATSAAFGAAVLWSTAFSDAAGFASSVALYGTVRLADIDGDGLADACARDTDGIWCAINTGALSFAPATAWLGSEFTDALGWDAAQHGATIQLGDINGDGRADVCGRGGAGVHCAVANAEGDAFEPAHLWSLSPDFDNASGWGDAPAAYRSLRLADIDGDGRAELCGRAPTGLVCAVSNGTNAFDRAQPLAPHDYTDALGWSADRYGTTMMFGDLDADYHADVCGRGSAGLLCAIAP